MDGTTLIDLFNDVAFRAIEVTRAIQNTPYIPGILNSINGLFETDNAWSRNIAIRKEDVGFALIPTSPIGAPPVEWERAGEDIRPFRTRRFAKGSTLYAEELQGIINMPRDMQVTTIQSEMAKRMARIRQDAELTHEHMRFGAVLGKVVDADGTTVLDDWYANWGVSEPSEIDFDLDTAGTNVRAKCQQVIDAVRDADPTGWIEGRTRLHALAGRTFYDSLIAHATVKETYLGYEAAAQLRQQASDQFEFGGIVWHRYIGMATGEFAIAANKARFFPVGGNGTFVQVWGPGEFIDFVNTPGQPTIAITIPDRDRGAWIRTELYSYPLMMCLRPKMLHRATT